ncbi:MAG: hypothetical protein IJZ16_10280 [Clostridia bacterium]|nr:hypothetical protein [Clostridia bacterium]
MNATINKNLISINIKEYLNQTIAKYHQLNAELETAIKTANQQYKDGFTSKIYTDEHLSQLLHSKTEQASNNFISQAKALNSEVKNYIAELKKEILLATSSTQKSADYAVSVNNALQFLQLEGASINDETAFQILHNFINDIETMQRFRSVIEHQKDEKLTDAHGNTTFPLTFGQLENYERFFKTFAELETTVESLFVRKKTETETEYIANGAKLSVPMDGYMQLISEKNATEQAGTVEKMAGELFTDRK